MQLIEIYADKDSWLTSDVKDFLDISPQSTNLFLYYDNEKCVRIENARFLEKCLDMSINNRDELCCFLMELIKLTTTQTITTLDDKITTSENFFKITSFLTDYTNKFSIYSGFEILFLSILAIEMSNTSLIFDLVPGIGKTFQMIKLMEMYNNEIIICTPTAISAQLYNNRNVRTVHSTFKIDPFENVFDLKIENIDKFKKYKAIVFDEFSMISHWIFVKIFMELPKDIVVILVGDSSQLAPPMGKEPDFVKLSKYRNFKRFSTDYSCKIFRFYQSTCGGGSSDNNNFVQNIHALKKLIKMDNKKKNLKINFDEMFVSWFKFFCQFGLDTSGSSISLVSTIEKISKIQYSNYQKILAEKYDDLEKIPVIFSYKNAENFKIQTQVYAKLSSTKLGEVSIFENVNSNNMFREFCENFSNLFLSEKIWNDPESRDKVIKFVSMNSFLFDYMNKFLPASNIRCRKNMPWSGCVNGDIGSFVGIDFVYSNSKFFKKIKIDDNHCLTLVSNDCVLNFCLKCVDYKNKELKRHHVLQESLCQKCGNCIMCEDNILIHPVYWQTFYTATMYNVQGQTISSEDLFIDTSLALRTNKLRCLYILVTRVKNPAQIHIDYDFVIESLRAIYNTSKTKPVFSKSIYKLLSMSSPNCATVKNMFTSEESQCFVNFLEYLKNIISNK